MSVPQHIVTARRTAGAILVLSAIVTIIILISAFAWWYTRPYAYQTTGPLRYSTGADANSWCDGEGIDPDNCYAKLLRHTGNAEGTIEHRL